MFFVGEKLEFVRDHFRGDGVQDVSGLLVVR